MDKWPRYYQNQLIVNDGMGVAVVCGWTKKELLWNNLSEEARKKVSVVGQLYSKEGINYIIRNIFLNKNIRHIVITGSDLSQSLDEFQAFLDSGNTKFLHSEIPAEKVKEFQEYFSKHYSRVEVDKLNDYILGLDLDKDYWCNEEISFSDHKVLISNTFPSEETGFRIEERKVANAWLKVLDRVVKFGKEKMSSYDEPQRELLNMVTVITEDSSKDPFLPDYMYSNREDIFRYYPQIMTAMVPEGVEYTYGSRLRNHMGKDQIREMIKELGRERYSRRALAVTWNVEKDCGNSKCPCLDLIQAVVQEGKVYLTAYFRSNDMFRAWPQNAYGLLAIQEEIAGELSLKMGKLTIISCSAHIYERDMGEAKEVLSKYKALECAVDSRGSFVISLDEGDILVKHIDYNGFAMQEFRGKSFMEMRDKLIPFISDIAHAIYVGAELMKAEKALRENNEYIQDS